MLKDANGVLWRADANLEGETLVSLLDKINKTKKVWCYRTELQRWCETEVEHCIAAFASKRKACKWSTQYVCHTYIYDFVWECFALGDRRRNFGVWKRSTEETRRITFA